MNPPERGASLESCPYIPVGARLVVQELKGFNSKQGGLFLPEANRMQPAICEVLAVGPDAKTARPGDQVIVSPAILTARCFFLGTEYITIEEAGVWGVVKPECRVTEFTADESK